MNKKPGLVEEYAALIEPLLELAKLAYGSRDTKSPQHDASREYTRLLVEFYGREGSLLLLSKRLGVTYAGMRRRITTSSIPASSGRARKKFDDLIYSEAVESIRSAKKISTEEYHDTIRKHYEAGLSLAHIARELGLSGANPLYYGVSRSILRRPNPDV